MSVKASLPEQYSGDLVTSLINAVEQAQGSSSETSEKPKKPALIHKQDGRNYLRLTEIPQHAELQCATSDCGNRARLLVDSRDCEVLAYCEKCAHVEFAMWMVGV